jgi:hypothetical protein
MANPDLTKFIESALAAGANRPQIADALAAAGWPPEQITDGLGHFSDVEFVIPVPRPKSHVSARDAFLYLVMFSTLYVSAYQLGNLLFQFINLAIPDELEFGYREYVVGSIRWSTSALIVAFPIFLSMTMHINKGIAADPTRRSSGVRKWLTYLTLTGATLIVVGDIIMLLYNVLSGDLTLRFVLKVLVVAVIAGAVFSYYTWWMKGDDGALQR